MLWKEGMSVIGGLESHVQSNGFQVVGSCGLMFYGPLALADFNSSVFLPYPTVHHTKLITLACTQSIWHWLFATAIPLLGLSSAEPIHVQPCMIHVCTLRVILNSTEYTQPQVANFSPYNITPHSVEALDKDPLPETLLSTEKIYLCRICLLLQNPMLHTFAKVQ